MFVRFASRSPKYVRSRRSHIILSIYNSRLLWVRRGETESWYTLTSGLFFHVRDLHYYEKPAPDRLPLRQAAAAIRVATRENNLHPTKTWIPASTTMAGTRRARRARRSQRSRPLRRTSRINKSTHPRHGMLDKVPRQIYNIPRMIVAPWTRVARSQQRLQGQTQRPQPHREARHRLQPHREA